MGDAFPPIAAIRTGRVDICGRPPRYDLSGGVLRAPGFMKTEAEQLLLELPHGAFVATIFITA
ncbi:MAG: hypothetical protein EON93_05310 [Burkholderiales bacterium]|nr:MAG: hypothetical protein EON93_05310 [Burkholderiales bacterium]